MPKLKQPETIVQENAETVSVELPPVQIVQLDPSSPGIRSIVRVVIATLILLWIGSYLENVITSLSSLFFVVILSVFFAYLLDPLVRGIRMPFKRRNVDWLMPRVLAILIAYAIVFTVVGVAVASIAPRVVEQAKEFGTSVPSYANAARERLNDLNRRFDRLKIPDEVQIELNKKAADIGSGITSSVGGFLLLTASFVPWLILIPILAFFFLKDVNLFRLAVLRAFPAGKLRMRAENVLADVNTTLAAYTRAQITSCLLIGFICTIGFYTIGLKYALLLGILAAIFEFVPLLGPATIGLIVISDRNIRRRSVARTLRCDLSDRAPPRPGLCFLPAYRSRRHPPASDRDNSFSACGRADRRYSGRLSLDPDHRGCYGHLP